MKTKFYFFSMLIISFIFISCSKDESVERNNLNSNLEVRSSACEPELVINSHNTKCGGYLNSGSMTFRILNNGVPLGNVCNGTWSINWGAGNPPTIVNGNNLYGPLGYYYNLPFGTCQYYEVIITFTPTGPCGECNNLSYTVSQWIQFCNCEISRES